MRHHYFYLRLELTSPGTEWYCDVRILPADLIVLRQVSNEASVPSYQQTTLTWQAGHVSPVRIHTVLICHNREPDNNQTGSTNNCVVKHHNLGFQAVFSSLHSCMQPFLKILWYLAW